ncbi:MAG TPA: molecular chaperone DnaJ [Geobacter sp.]|nr:molecular chaperone DnaJ [Geobacter sp.]
MTAHYQSRLPEEIELEQKRAELASLRARHAAAVARLHELREEIAGFERNYQETLGRRMAELERIEAEIARLSGCYTAAEPAEEEKEEEFDTRTYRKGRSFRADTGTGAKGRVWKSDEQDIKALYREVAKAIHPDLAGDGPGSHVRHELMLKANRAYAEEDTRTLREILRNWRKHFPGQAEANDIGAELSRVKRQIAVEAQALREVEEQVEQLRTSYVCRFKLRVDESLAAGSDLFAEMVSAVDMNITRALRRLAALQEEKERRSAGRGTSHKRIIRFPSDLPCGTLYHRDLNSANFSQWRKSGPAIGDLQVYADQAVRLDIKEQTEAKLKLLQDLHADDLQALYLYQACDADLDNIVHLTGLEELYLCGRGLTDAALLCISSLTNLKRIYLYQTSVSDRGLLYLQGIQGLKGLTSSGNSITDEGLAVFQKAIPGVKTVSFKWKR